MIKLLNALHTITYLFIIVNTIYPISDTLIIGDISGKVYELNQTGDNDFSCKQLSSSHQPDTMIRFFNLHGKMSTQGFLFSIGDSSPEDREENALYVNIFNLGSPGYLPCAVLLGLRAGYDGVLQPEQNISSSLYFTTWTFTNTS